MEIVRFPGLLFNYLYRNVYYIADKDNVPYWFKCLWLWSNENASMIIEVLLLPGLNACILGLLGRSIGSIYAATITIYSNLSVCYPVSSYHYSQILHISSSILFDFGLCVCCGRFCTLIGYFLSDGITCIMMVVIDFDFLSCSICIR